jgi:hypothetical protein
MAALAAVAGLTNFLGCRGLASVVRQVPALGAGLSSSRRSDLAQRVGVSPVKFDGLRSAKRQKVPAAPSSLAVLILPRIESLSICRS